MGDNSALRMFQVILVFKHAVPDLGTYANDALGSDELDQLVLHGSFGIPLAVGLDVA